MAKKQKKWHKVVWLIIAISTILSMTVWTVGPMF